MALMSLTMLIQFGEFHHQKSKLILISMKPDCGHAFL